MFTVGQLSPTSSCMLSNEVQRGTTCQIRSNSVQHYTSTPDNIADLELKKVVPRNFSDIATPTEAAQKLISMRMSTNQPIASYNYYSAAVHEVAFDITLNKQFMRFALEDYANSLPEYTAGKLTDKLVKVNSFIKNLQDAMDHAFKIDQEPRQAEVMRSRRNASSSALDTTENTTVNEISEFDLSYIAAKQGNSRFNSTMKPGHHRESKEFSPEADKVTLSETSLGIETEVTTTTTTIATGESTNTNTLLESQDTTLNLNTPSGEGKENN